MNKLSQLTINVFYKLDIEVSMTLLSDLEEFMQQWRAWTPWHEDDNDDYSETNSSVGEHDVK